MFEKKEFSNEKLEKVVGESHVSPLDIKNYIGKDMKFSYGPFGAFGPYPVHIDDVIGTIVKMTFTDPNNHPDYDSNLTDNWTRIKEHTWRWDYDDCSDTWLE